MTPVDRTIALLRRLSPRPASLLLMLVAFTALSIQSSDADAAEPAVEYTTSVTAMSDIDDQYLLDVAVHSTAGEFLQVPRVRGKLGWRTEAASTNPSTSGDEVEIRAWSEIGANGRGPVLVKLSRAGVGFYEKTVEVAVVSKLQPSSDEVEATFACEVITPPQLLRRAHPHYSENARKRQISGIVELEAKVDEAGKVTDVIVLKGAARELNEAAVAALKEWEYAPALKGRTAVAASLKLTTRFRLGSRRKSSKPSENHPLGRTPARVRVRTEPPYPKEARAEGLKGEVIVEADTDIEGNVVAAKVREGLAPLLDEAALEAMYFWKFEPPTEDGEAVPTRLVIRFKFSPDR